MHSGHDIQCPLFLSDFNSTWFLQIDFRKIKYQMSWKSFHWELSFSMCADRETERQTDGRTDGHDKAIVAFGNFTNAPKIMYLVSNTSQDAVHTVQNRNISLPLRRTQSWFESRTAQSDPVTKPSELRRLLLHLVLKLIQRTSWQILSFTLSKPS
jgi:hypothetical protein